MWIRFVGVWCGIGAGLLITLCMALGDEEKQVLLPGLRRRLVRRCLGFHGWLLLGELSLPVGDALLLHLVLVGCALLPRTQLVCAVKSVVLVRLDEMALPSGPLGGKAGAAAVGRGGLHGGVVG